MHVASVRRYPVKSMGGESLESVQVNRHGLIGDRRFAVVEEDGRLVAGKTNKRFRRRDAVFAYRAFTSASGVRVVRGLDAWNAESAELDRELSEEMGAQVRVRPADAEPFHDAGRVSLVSDASLQWCRDRLGVDADARRLRANLVVSAREAFAEESWFGADLMIGGSVLRVVRPIVRCRVIDVAQDGVSTTTPWLSALGAERELQIGVYADVVRPGIVSVGDALQVREPG